MTYEKQNTDFTQRGAVLQLEQRVKARSVPLPNRTLRQCVKRRTRRRAQSGEETRGVIGSSAFCGPCNLRLEWLRACRRNTEDRRPQSESARVHAPQYRTLVALGCPDGRDDRRLRYFGPVKGALDRLLLHSKRRKTEETDYVHHARLSIFGRTNDTS
jgi:hypothetical protein